MSLLNALVLHFIVELYFFKIYKTIRCFLLPSSKNERRKLTGLITHRYTLQPSRTISTHSRLCRKYTERKDGPNVIPLHKSTVFRSRWDRSKRR